MAKINRRFFKFMLSRNQDWLLEEILRPGEEVLYAISNCRIKGIRPVKERSAPLGVIAATNERVIFCIPRLFGEFQIEEFPYDQVTSIGPSETPYFSGCIDFVAGRVKKVVFWINPKSDAEEFIEVVRELISSRS